MPSRAVVLQFLGESGQLKATLAGINKDLAGTEGAVGSLARSGGKLSALGQALTKYVSLPLGLIGAESVKLALTYDGAMNKVAAITTATKQDMQLWQQSVLDLSGKVAQTPEQLADALYFVASSGFHGAQAMDILTAAAKASTSGLGDTATNAKTLDAVLNAYHGTALTATQATDYMIAAIAQGDMPSQDLTQSIGQVLSIAAEAGVPFKDLAAAIAASSKQGINAQRSTQGLRFMLSRFISPTKEATSILGKYGWTVKSLNDELQHKGLLETLQHLHGTLSEQDFAKVVGGARGLSTALSLVGKNAGQVQDVFKGVDAGKGALNNAYNTAEQNPQVKLQTNLNALRAAGITLGNQLIPIVLKVANVLSRMATDFNKLSPGVQHFLAVLMVVLVVAGPLLKLFGTFFKLLSGGIKIVLTIARWIGVLAEALGPVIEFMAPIVEVIGEVVAGLLTALTPVGWVILAVIALAAAFALAYKFSGTFRKAVGAALSWVGAQAKVVVQFWTGVGEAIGNGFMVGVDAVVGAWNTVYGAVSSAISAVGEVIMAVVGAVSTGIGAVVGAFETVWKVIGPVVTKIAEVIGFILIIPLILLADLLIVSFNAFGRFLVATTVPIFHLLRAAWTVVYRGFVVELNFLRSLFNAVFSAVKAVVVAAFDAIRLVWTDLWNAMLAVFTPIWTAIYNSITSVLSSIISVFGNLYTVVVAIWGALWTVAFNVWNGFYGFISAAWAGLSALVSATWSPIAHVLSGIWSGIWAGIKTSWSTISTFFTRDLPNTIGSGVSGIGDIIARPFKAGINTIIGGLDVLIRGWNSLDFHIPKFDTGIIGVPTFGPWDFGTPDIGTIPQFADGALVNKPTLAVFGEAGSELALPLTRRARALSLMRKSGAADMLYADDARRGGRGGSAPVTVTQQFYLPSADPDAIARKTAKAVGRAVRV